MMKKPSPGAGRRGALGVWAVLIGALLLGAGLPPCLAQGVWHEDLLLEDRADRWEITARELSYSEDESLYSAEGDVVISGRGAVLSADSARYNARTGIAEVRGDIRLESNGDVLMGESGVFDLTHQAGQITCGHLFLRENNVHVRGASIQQLGPATYAVEDCEITTCDGDKPDWSITGSKVTVTLEGYGKVTNAAFRIRDLPVFYVPYAVFPAKTKRSTGVLPPRLGHSERNGSELEIPFFWALSDQADVTFYERYMSKRGLLQGLEARYLAGNGSEGAFLLDTLLDRNDTKDLGDPDEIDLSPFPRTNETRYWFRGKADQVFPHGVTAHLNADYVSDQDYFREFNQGLFGARLRPDLSDAFNRPVDDPYSPLRRSELRLDRDGEGYSLQASTAYYQRPENPPTDTTPQPLVGLHYGLLPRAFSRFPSYFSATAGHTVIHREAGDEGHSLTLSPRVTYPLRLGRYIEVEQTLSLDTNTRWVDGPAEQGEQEIRAAAFSETRLSTVLERTIPFRWREVTRVKHKVTPSLSYTYRDYGDAGKTPPWFEPIDEEGRINQITLSLENVLDAREESGEGEVSYRQWGTLNLLQGYDLHEARREVTLGEKRQSFTPLTGVMSLMPAPFLDLEAEARWDHYENRIIQTDLSVAFRLPRSGGRSDSLSLDYLYERGERSSINGTLNVHLGAGFSGGASLLRDLDAGDDLEQQVWVDYASQCWALRCSLGEQDGSAAIMVSFRLLGLESLGLP